jgi:hypothetical protein
LRLGNSPYWLKPLYSDNAPVLYYSALASIYLYCWTFPAS